MEQGEKGVRGTGEQGTGEQVNRGNGEQGVLMAQVNTRNKGKGGDRGGQEEQWNRETEQQGNRENRETE